MEITFVRHGQPRWSIDGMAQPDPSLTDLGAEQARRAARRLAAESPEGVHLLVSSSTRARETAVPIADELGVEPEVIPDLTEIRMPPFSGQPDEVVIAFFRDLYRREAEDWWEGAPGGESFGDFHARVTECLLGLLAARGAAPRNHDGTSQLWDIADPDAAVIVVAHAGVNAVALGHLLGLQPTPWEWERFVLRHASIARVETMRIGSAHIFSMRSFNDVEHLPAEQRTR